MIPEVEGFKLFDTRVPRVGGGDPRKVRAIHRTYRCSPRRRG